MRMRPTALAIAIGALVGAQSSCIVGGAFACTENAECSGDGVCEPTGWCSFPDASCSSGARYSPWAGDAFANDCTEEEMVTTGTSAEEGSTAADSTSGPPVTRDSEGPECGNGITEVGEDCDDMNAVDGDGCNACLDSGTVRWSNVTASVGDDEGHEVAVTSAGTSYVVGQWAPMDGQGWLLRFEPDGSQTKGWSANYGAGPEDAAFGVVLLEGVADDCLEGDVNVTAVFVAGYETPFDNADTEPESQQANHALKRYDDAESGPVRCWQHSDNTSQTIDMETRFGDDKLNAVATGVDEMVAFGHVRLDLRGNDADAAVKGVALVNDNELWSWYGGLSGDDDFATSGVVDETGRVWAVGRIRNNDADAWIAHIEVDGTVGTRRWTWVSATPELDDRLHDVAFLASGDLLAVGRRGDYAWLAVWPAKTEPDADPVPPLVDLELATPGVAQLHGVAIDGAGAVVVVGEVATVDHGDDAWVQKLAPDLGTVIWQHQIDGTAHGDDIARGVAIGPDDSVVAVGDQLQVADDEDQVDRDVWIEAYEP
jgi:cysteine-rich repeat protein